jgi:metal-dependent amidase/aminoacylase/carboxypeptidase family protein
MAAAAFLMLAGPDPIASQSTDAARLRMAVEARLAELREDMIEVRRDIHRHPELSGREQRTAGIVARRLRAAGYDVRTTVGGHGVVAILRGGRDGRTVAFRADMDAVESGEPDPVPFASTVPGVRHICGHDIHTTVGLALAEGLAVIRDELAGSVMFIFQPAEETATGARAMIEEGVFSELQPDAIFAYHTSPLEVGQVGTRSGTLLPGRDRIRVRLAGEGDLSEIANRVVVLIRATSTVTRSTSSVTGEFALTRVFRSQSEQDRDGWLILGQATTSSVGESERVEAAIRDGLSALSVSGVTGTLEYQKRAIAGVTNDPELEQASHGALKSVLGEAGVVAVETIPTGFSEDFGSFQERVPGVMYYLGVSNSTRGWVGMPHSPEYVADEAAIETGARAMSAVMLDFLHSSPAGEEDSDGF